VGGDRMNEESIIKSYNEGINAVITLVKDLNHDFASQMGSLTSEINTLSSEMIALKIANLALSTRIAELEARLTERPCTEVQGFRLRLEVAITAKAV
jgi:septal ring factor EnvC (AmiA/AmiB activator)